MLLTNWLRALTSRLKRRPTFRSRDRRAIRRRWQTAFHNRISTAEVLEDRTLLTALSIDGTTRDDVLTITATSEDSGTYQLNSDPAVTFTAVTGFTFNGLRGDDTLVINNPTGGLFHPVEGIIFNGGSGGDTINGDTFQILGGAVTTIEHVFASDSEGSIFYGEDFTPSFSYTGMDFSLQPSFDTIVATDRIFSYAGADEIITISDSATAGQTRINSTLGEFVSFLNPTGLLEINTEGIAVTGDTININGVDAAFDADVIVNGNSTDTITMQSIDIGSGALDIVSMDEVNIEGTFATTGLVEINANSLISFTNAGVIEAGASDIDLRAGAQVALGSVSTTGNVRVTATTGQIFDNNASANNIKAKQVALRAGTVIGTLGNTIETQISTLAATASTGLIRIENKGDLAIGNVDSLNGITASDLVEVSTTKSMAVNSPILASSINLKVDDDSATTGEDISIFADLTSNSSFINLLAADDVTISSSAKINAATSAIFEIDSGDADDAGGLANLNGAIIAAAGITVLGQGDDDQVKIDSTGGDLNNGGTIDGIQGAFTFDGLGGTDSLFIDDSGDVTGDLMEITNVGSGEGLVRGASAFDFAFGGVESLTVYGGTGADEFTVAPNLGTAINITGGSPDDSTTDILTYLLPTGEDPTLNPSGSEGGTISISGGFENIVFNEIENSSIDVIIDGTSGDDVLTITPTGTNSGTYQLNDGSVIDFSDIIDLTFNGLDGDDTLVINNPDGSLFAPPNGIIFNGGTGGEVVGDTLEVLGGTATTVEHRFVSDSDGTIFYNNEIMPAITYTGLEPVTDTITATERIFSFTGAGETVTLSDDGDKGDNESQIDSTLGESVTFLNPTDSLTIFSLDLTASDVYNVQGLDSLFDADLTFNTNSDDTVNFQTNATDLGSGELFVSTGSIVLDQDISTTGNLTLNAKGSSISDGGTNDSDSLTAASAILLAEQNIGESIALNLDIDNLVASTNTGLINLSNTGSLTIDGNGVQAGTELSLTTSGGMTIANGVSVATFGGDLELTANDDINLGFISANGNEVRITSSNGMIYDSIGSALIAADRVALRAATGIGTSNVLNTAVNTLAASTTNGTVNLFNTGALEIGTVDGLEGVTTSGDIVLETSSPLDVITKILGDTVILTAGDSAATGDDLTISANVTSNIGVIELNAGDDFHLSTGATLDAASALNINVDHGGGIDARVGGVANLNGTLMAGAEITVNGNVDGDTVIIDDNGGTTDDGGTLDGIQAAFTFNGNSGDDQLTFDDSGDTTGDTIEITNTGIGSGAVTGVGMVGFGFNFTVQSGILLTTGSDADEITVSPNELVAINLLGRDPGVTPGDTLNYITPPGETATLTPDGTDGGTFRATGAFNFDHLVFDEIETVNSLTELVINGTPGNDILTINATGPNTGTYEFQGFVIDLGNLSSLTFNGLEGDDVLVINNPTGALFDPINGITFNGGTGGETNGDRIRIMDGTATTVEHVFVNDSDGSIFYDGEGAATITYTGLEPVIDTIIATDRIFSFTGADETITLSDNGQFDDGVSQIDSTLAEFVAFVNPTGTLTINTEVSGGSGADTININGVDSTFDAALTVNADNDDTITTGAVDIGSGTLNLIANQININETLTTTGSVNIDAATDISMTATGAINADANDIDLTAGTGVQLGSVTTTGDVRVTTTAGSITDNSGGGTNITANQVALRANNGVDNLVMAVNTLAALSADGGVVISNTGTLVIGSVDGLDGVRGATGVNIETSGALTVNSPVSGSVFRLDALDSAAAGENLTINADVTQTSGGVSASLRAGDNLTVATGVTVSAIDRLIVSVDVGNADSGTGGVANLNGRLTAGDIVVNGNSDDDTIILDDNGGAINDGGSVIGIQGALTFFAGGGTDTLSLDDSGDTTGDTIEITNTGTGNGSITGSGAFDFAFDSLENLNLNTGTDSDDITVSPNEDTAIKIVGGDPATSPGDTLNYNTPSGETPALTPDGTDGGTISVTGGFADVVFDEIESTDIPGLPSGSSITVDGTSNNDILIVTATSANSGTYQLNSGSVINFTDITEFTFNGLDGDDLLHINNPTGALFAPLNGITFNGGTTDESNGDSLRILGGSANTVEHVFGNDGDGSVFYDGESIATITYTSVDNMADSVLASDRIFNFTAAAETITLANSFDASTSLIGSNQSIGFVQVLNPTTSLTINTELNGGSGIDAVNIEGVGTPFNANLNINTGSNDTVTFQTNTTDLGSGDLLVDSGNVVIDQNLTAAGNVTINSAGTVTFVDGSMLEITNTGLIDIEAVGDIALSNLSTLGDAHLTSTTGAITDNTANETSNITADGLALRAATGIGTNFVGGELETSVNTLAATTSTEGIFVDNAGALTIGNVDGLAGVIAAAGDVGVTASSPLTINSEVIGHTVVLGARDTSGTGDDLTINSDVTSVNGGINLAVGDDLLVSTGASVNSNTFLTITIDNGDADAGVGATANLNGILSAATQISLLGNGDNDIYIIDSNGGTANDGGTVDRIMADSVVISNAGGQDQLIFDDSGDATGDTIAITNVSVGIAQVSGLGLVDFIFGSPSSSEIKLNTGTDVDDITVSPHEVITINIVGGDPAISPGDTLTYNTPIGETPTLTPDGTDGGTISVTGGFADVVFDEIETTVIPGLPPVTSITVDGTVGSDVLTITPTSANSGTYQLNGGTVITFTDITDFTFNGLDGDDTLVINNPAGALFDPTDGIIFNGGTGGEVVGDTLEILGGSATTVEHRFVNNSDGSIFYNGESTATITYTGLEPITDTITATDRIFSFTGGSERVTLSDDGDVGDNESLIDSTQGESVTFVNPTDSLTISNLNNAARDTYNAEGLDSLFDADLTFNTIGNDEVIFQTNATDLGSGDLFVRAGEIILDQDVSTTGNVTLNAINGSIVDGETSDSDTLTATSAILFADSDIGEIGAIDVDIDSLEASTNDGRIALSNNGSLTINGNGVQAEQEISLTASGGITIVDGVSITSVERDVELTANDDIDLGTIIATNEEVRITSTTGMINDNTAAESVLSPLITARGVALQANLGIGAGDDIDTDVFELAASSTNGSVNIINNGRIDIQQVGNLTGVTAFGDVILETSRSMDVSSDISGGTVTLIIADSATTGNDLDIRANVNVASTSGALEFNVGDELLIDSTAFITAAAGTGTININLDQGTADVGTGSNLNLTQSLLSAAQVNITGGADDDDIKISPRLNMAFNILGGDETTSSPGDFLSYFSPAGETVDFLPTGAFSGTITSTGGFGDVVLDEFESLVIPTAPSLLEINIDGTTGDDELIINAINANSGTYQLNGGTVTNFVNITDFTFNGLDGDDKLVINNPTGAIFGPVNGINFDGGTGGETNGDSLEILGGTTVIALHKFMNNNDGSIEYSDGIVGTTITYTGLEPILDTVVATSRSFSFLGAAETITLSDDGDVGDGESIIDSTLGESVVFANPTDALLITTRDGTGLDDIIVDGLDSTFDAGLLIRTPSIEVTPGSTNSVTINALNLGSGLLDVETEVAMINGLVETSGAAIINASAELAMTGGVISADSGVLLNSGTNLSLGQIITSGDVILEAGSGSIIDTNANVNNISANQLSLTANGDISDALETEITALEAFVLGSLNIENTGSLDLGFVGGRDNLVVGNSSKITSTDTLTVTEDVMASGGNLQLQNTGGDFNLDSSATILFTGDFLIDIDSAGAVTQADGSVIAVNGSGAVEIEAVNDIALAAVVIFGTGDVKVTSTSGAILDNDSQEDPLIIANSAVLRASTGIGIGDDLNLDVNTLAADSTTGIINLSESNEFAVVFDGITIGTVDGLSGISGSDAITVLTVGSLTVDENISSTGTASPISITSGTDIDVNAVIRSNGGSIDLFAENDLLLGAASVVDTTSAAAITLIADNDATGGGSFTQTEGGSVNARGGDLDIEATDDILIANLQSGGGLVLLDSDSGAIIDNTSAESALITADRAALRAGTGIGSFVIGGDINLNVNTLAATTATGDINISNTDGLNIGSVDSLDGVTATTGTVSITTLSSLTINSPVSGNAVILDTRDSAGTGDDLTINADVTSTDSNILLLAGDDLHVSTGVNVDANNILFIGIDNGNSGTIDSGVGATANINGTLNAGADLQLRGGVDDDVFIIDSNGGTTNDGGLVDGITAGGQISFDTSIGQDEIIFDDSGDTTGDTIALIDSGFGTGTVAGLGRVDFLYFFGGSSVIRLTSGTDIDDVSVELGDHAPDELFIDSAGGTDDLTILGRSGEDDSLSVTPGTSDDSGIIVDLVPSHQITFSGITGSLLIDGQGSLVSDEVMVSGTSAVDTTTIAPTNGVLQVEIEPTFKTLGVQNIDVLSVDTGNGQDVIRVSPDPNIQINIIGGDPTAPAMPGDFLTYITPTGEIATHTAQGADGGTITSTGGFEDVIFNEIESLTIGGSILVNGTTRNNVLTINATGPNSGNYQITNGGLAGPIINFTDITEFIFNGLEGDDTLIINNPTGDLFDPLNGITFNGGTGGEVLGDTLEIIGGTATTVEHRFTNNNDGSVFYDGEGTATITYTGLEPVIDMVIATDRIFSFTGDAENITLSDDSSKDNGMSVIDSDLFGESVAFLNATNSVTINTETNGGSGADAVSIIGVDSTFDANLTVNAGKDDKITTETVDIGSGALSLIADQISINDTLKTTGQVNINANSNILMGVNGWLDGGLSAIDLTAGMNVQLASVTTGGEVRVTATNGEITNNSNGGINISADRAALRAFGQIDNLVTGINTLAATSTTKGVVLNNLRNVIVGSVDGLDGATATNGSVQIDVTGALTVNSAISAAVVFLTTIDSLTAGEDITINADVTHTDGFNLSLLAADNLTISQGVKVSSTSGINLGIDFLNADTGTGGTAHINGILTAATTINLSGNVDDDTFFIDGTILETELTLNGSDGFDRLNFDPKGFAVDPLLLEGPTGSPGFYGIDDSIRAIDPPSGTTFPFVNYTSIQFVDLVIPPAIDTGGPYTINEGDDLQLNAADLSGDPTASFAWDLDGDNQFDDAVGANPVVLWATLFAAGINDNGTYQIAVQATNSQGVETAFTTVTVINTAPTIEISGNSTVVEGTEYNLQLGDVVDPGNDTVFAYTIDWGDGQTDHFQGTPVSGSFVTHTFLEGPGHSIIQIILEDEDGIHSVANQVDVSVENAPPVITQIETNAFEAGTVFSGELATLSADFTDLGIFDTHTAVIDWGDGSALEPASVTELNGSGTLSGDHVYSAPGIYTITVTLTDDDGDTTQATTTAFIDGTGLNNGTLNIFGTDLNDYVRIYRYFNSYVLIANFLPEPKIQFFDVDEVHSIKVTAGKGNDYVQIDSNVFIPTILIGGDGNDQLFGGSGHNILLGGNGNDYLVGWYGTNILVGGDGDDWLRGGFNRDILIGGRGRDNLKGGFGGDLLIGGFTSFDTNLDALMAIFTEWNSEASYQTRINNLLAGVGPHLVALKTTGPDATVFDDGDEDKLRGEYGRDWFLGNDDDDRILDKWWDEVFTDTDLLDII